MPAEAVRYLILMGYFGQEQTAMMLRGITDVLRRQFKRRIVAFAVALGTLPFCATGAQAAIIYNWSGVCGNSCVGTANGTLVLEDTFPATGTTDDIDLFISWTFDGPESYSLTRSDLDSFFVALLPGPDLSVPRNVFINASDGRFFTSRVNPTIWATGIDLVTSSAGPSHTWTLSVSQPVPEPATGLLFAAGLGLLSAIRRRRAD
jgi:hypothetical protein